MIYASRLAILAWVAAAFLIMTLLPDIGKTGGWIAGIAAAPVAWLIFKGLARMKKPPY
jgi:hypothetical protein